MADNGHGNECRITPGCRQVLILGGGFAGVYAAIGRGTGVARILGINFSGVLARSLWRAMYLCELPGLEKKLRVVLDWTMDIHACAPESASSPPRGIFRARYAS